MSFNIFDSATKDSIRVGYIDPDRGYLTGQSIYEANVHASKNPGAVFILETRDRVRYLTINEVNKLTVKDITPDEGGPCEEGIKGLNPLDISINLIFKKKPTKAFLFKLQLNRIRATRLIKNLKNFSTI